MLLERLRAPAGQAPTWSACPGAPPNGAVPYGGTAAASAWQRGNVLTLIAGIGVLLLAMGVGVLIGRSGSSSAGSTPAPQVITVGGATGAASTATTPTTTPEETASSAKSGRAPPRQSRAKRSLAPGVGSVPSKPAPPSVLKSLHTKSSGGSYEQKSKALPNVVKPAR